MFESLPDFGRGFGDPPGIQSSLPMSEWESLIRDAGQYVRPGDQLRGRILEAVSNRRQRRQRWRHCFGALTLGTSAMFLVSVVGHFAADNLPRGRSPRDLHEQADARARSEGIAWEWALTEVLYDRRRAESTELVETVYRARQADRPTKQQGGSR